MPSDSDRPTLGKDLHKHDVGMYSSIAVEITRMFK